MNKNYMRVIPKEWRNIAKVYTALGDVHRQRILLTFEPGERLNVGQIGAVSTLSRSTVSHHLKLLKAAGVLDSEKVGKEVRKYPFIGTGYIGFNLALPPFAGNPDLRKAFNYAVDKKYLWEVLSPGGNTPANGIINSPR